MPRSCTVCSSERLDRINRELIGGKPYRDIAGRHGLSKTAVARHKQAHLPASLALAKRNQETLSGENLLAEMAELKSKLRSGLEQAERAANPAAFVSFARELRQSLESYFQMAQAVAERAAEKFRREESAGRVPTVGLPPFEVDTVESCALMRGERIG